MLMRILTRRLKLAVSWQHLQHYLSLRRIFGSNFVARVPLAAPELAAMAALMPQPPIAAALAAMTP
jgi:hypothetical protein